MSEEERTYTILEDKGLVSAATDLYEKLPEHDGHIKVRRRAEEMTDALRPLLLAARHIVFVDPYFKASRNHFIETYRSLLNVVASRNDKSLVTVEHHIGIEREVVMIAEGEDRSVRIDELRKLFKNTQRLPQVQAISEDMIAEEIEMYRTGQ